jgi:integrase
VATGKVTISSISKLQGWLWDTQCVGFGARRQRNGVFFYCRYRHNGQQTVRSIGRHGSPWTPDTARNEARRLLGIVASGFDPHAQLLAGEGFATAVDRYLERKCASLKPNSFRGAEYYLRNHSAPLHRLRFDEIDRRKVAALLGQVETNSGPIARNRLRSALSAFYSWAIQEGLTETNPVQGTGKADEGNSRERVLTHNELRKLGRGLGEGSFADIIRLLLLTGQRRTEIGGLQWKEVDLARKLIVLPPARTKNGRQHEVPLSAQALTILERLPRRNSTDFIFGKRSGYSDWGRAKQELDLRLAIAPWRLHDLRRTCATQLGELGVQPHHIEAILNHYSNHYSKSAALNLPGHRSGVAGVYQRAKYADEMRAALQRWADHVDKITHIDD